MDWRRKQARSGTKLEQSVWKILTEMNLNYISNEMIHTPFRDFPIEADNLVEGTLVIEVQSTYFHAGHLRRQRTRARKDRAKRKCFQAMGFGFMELWDDELKWANQVRKGKLWRPLIKKWISKMLDYSRVLHTAMIDYRKIIYDAEPYTMLPGREGRVLMSQRRF